MNFKEFNKWKTDLYTPPQVDEAGDVSNDRVLKFELSYGDAAEIKKTPILAITLAEALYRSIYTVLIENCPMETELSSVSSDEEALIFKNKLISCLTFNGITINEDMSNSIEFTRNGVTYTITCDGYDFTKVDSALIEDDLIVVWEKPNDNDMICNICYNMTNIAVNLREINKLDSLLQLNSMVKNNLFTHSNFLVSKFGFASITDEDMDKYSNTFAKEVSYKRALMDKLKLDREIVSEQIKGLAHDYDLLGNALNRYHKIRRKLNRRMHDLREFVNNKISDMYPDAE